MTTHSVERTRVFWVTPEDDVRQHATLCEPPEEGGPVEVLGGHQPVHAPARKEPGQYQMWHTRPFCERCFTAYLSLPVTPPEAAG
ncbi:hypothetical protein [Actinopolyspora mortivallis]|uniref:hypothetical protein n=1 Tax=Actinopolyspora mortivallis TaxID=33906 RepID=UPI0003A9B09E|nr:hypothetical protein [Actinopolyspora mortivallis]